MKFVRRLVWMIGPLLAAFLCSVPALSQAALTADFYVAPNGNDANPGTVDFPFATVLQARNAVRQKIGVGLTTNVLVLIRGGTYELTQPLTFNVEDSGTDQYSITYAAAPGENVIISGGRKLSGWQVGDNGIWTVQIPEVSQGKWYFRSLYAGDTRAIRARHPSPDANPAFLRLAGAMESGDLQRYEVTLPPGQVANWQNLSDVEIVVLMEWNIDRKRLLSVDEKSNTALLMPPHTPRNGAYTLRAGWYYYLENALAFLDRPGEWYLNRTTGKLSYWARPGEDPTNTAVTAPVLTNILRVEGVENHPIKNLHFQGLTFSHADQDLPPAGFMGTGLAGDLKEAMLFSYCRDCSIVGCVLSHVDGNGLNMRDGCWHNLIKGNRIFDIGGTGVEIGLLHDSPVANQQTRINYLCHNEISDAGVTYMAGAGVAIYFAGDTVVSHNWIHNLPYIGIFDGADQFGKASSNMRNIIDGNQVDHVMKLLSDGGAIYTAGWQPGAQIINNYVHEVYRNYTAIGGPNNGIFFDDASKDILAENNLILQASGGPIRYNNGCNTACLDVRENFFGDYYFWKGKVGAYALKTADDHYFDIPHNPTLEPANLTVETWIRPLAFPQGGDSTTWLVCKNLNELTDGNYALAISHNNIGAYLNIGGGRENMFAAWSRNGPLVSNQWSHVAMTFDGHDLKVYCDGKLAASTPVNCARTAGTGLLRLGKRADGFDQSFNGVIDEVCLYNRALAPEEIAAHFTHPALVNSPQSPGTPTGLVAHWDFSDLRDKIESIKASAGPEEPYKSLFAQIHEKNAKKALLATKAAPVHAAP